MTSPALPNAGPIRERGECRFQNGAFIAAKWEQTSDARKHLRRGLSCADEQPAGSAQRVPEVDCARFSDGLERRFDTLQSHKCAETVQYTVEAQLLSDSIAST